MDETVNPGEEMDIRSYVRERYGKIAEKSASGSKVNCCDPSAQSSCCGPGEADLIQLDMISKMYADPAVNDLPSEVTNVSLGCGDPVTLASLQPGQTVLDLGSGGGIDCFLAAKKVGPSGRVIGVDMTAAMVEKARANKAKIGAGNVEFRLGEIEHLPVADNEVDVIISNCVINLSPDKDQVFREAYRVMKPGGKLAVSDIVTDGPLPDEIKSSLSAWAGCVAGALDVADYVKAIEAAGFRDVQVTRSYWEDDLVDISVQQMDSALAAQIDSAKGSGKAVLVVNDGGDGKMIEFADEAQKDFDPQKAIFSAKVTAYKPG